MPPPLHFVASLKPLAQAIVTELVERYGQTELAHAACVIAIGGDGTTLNALQTVLAMPRIPVFSMRIPGSVGALGNTLALDGLGERLARCRRIAIRPLRFEARHADGSVTAGIAINEVALVRRRFQATRLRIQIGSETEDIFGDGVVVASPIGSTGYCRSLGGPRLSLDTDMIALAGIAIRSPAGGFHLAAPGGTVVHLEVTDPTFRPARIETNSAIVRDICEVIVQSCRDLSLTLLLEPGDSIAMAPAVAIALGRAFPPAQDAE